MKDKKNIIVLVFFFGDFPWYFPYFFHSCKHNPEIDFLIITDNICDEDLLPDNIRFFNTTLQEMQAMATEKLGAGVTLQPHPYKFCDLRPAFGVIFEEYIKGYAFWGHADLDVIFGNIRSFVDESLLDEYDMICFRHDYITSWFTLYRNCSEVNRLYMQSKDYLKVFTTEKYYNFDETNFQFHPFSDGIPYEQIESEVESMTHVVKKLQEKNKLKAYFEMHALEGRPGRMKWENGQLIFKDQYDVILYHLIRLKNYFEPSSIPDTVPDTFYIGKESIYH